MSDTVKIALINSIPSYLTGAGVLLTAVMGILNHFAVRDVHKELNSMLTQRVKSAEDTGRIQERSEQREIDLMKKENK